MATDIDIIRRIKKKLEVELGQLPLDKIFGQSNYTKAYALDGSDRVTGLALEGLSVGTVLADIRLLKNLKKISLYQGQLQDPSFLKELQELDSLDLGGNKEINDYSFLKEITGLTSLGLGGNNLTNVSFLKELMGLTYLNLYDNKLTNVSFLKELTGLTSLDLGRNELTDISFLKELTELTSLSLGSNKEINDYSFLKELTGLTSLNLYGNKLTDISFLKELTELTSLSLGSNKEINNYSFLKELTGLTSLDLFGNKLTDVSFLKDMDKLTRVNLDENPVENPPPEIVKQGIEAIRDYLKSFDVSIKKKLNEVKVLLVGDGGAGKTSLVKQLQGKPFDQNESATHGINIITLNIDTTAAKGSAETVKAHLWDFGGQEIMHASHQFFLSKRSLYILVLDSRKDDKAEYWLKHIESFGGNSPVLIVINKIDENTAFDVDRNSLSRKYKNIKGFFRTSCQTGEGIAEFKKNLEKEIPGVELLRTAVAESWLQVKEKLERVTSERNYISDGMFMEICRENDITEESVRETLIEFLNELGIVLHFRRLMLQDFHVLNPCWVTEAVYKIINSPYLADNQGILEEKKLDFVLNEEPTKKQPLDLSLKNIKYESREQSYILSLMQEFQLCYTYGRGKILIPDLLPPHEPNFKPPGQTPLKFLIRYDFLPKSIMPRFIVKSHRDIKGELRWRTGVVLQNKDFKTTASVRADEEDKTIYIRVSGERR
ncbi:MAG: leucine-rich repeat domain-containing protein, partial [Candidatus Aminicenantes bacterium]|nr:leucine-rich repeat domain-containing protein [Candidatus Aminicenantes bacterium]